MCEVNNKLLTKVNEMTEQIDQLQSTVREKEVVIALNKNQVETIKSKLEAKIHEESMRKESLENAVSVHVQARELILNAIRQLLDQFGQQSTKYFSATYEVKNGRFIGNLKDNGLRHGLGIQITNQGYKSVTIATWKDG